MDAATWLATLFAHAEGLVELRACPNARDSGRAASIFTRDADEVTEFAAFWAGKPYGVYFGCGTRRQRRGTAADVLWLPALWADIDGGKPLDTLLACYCPPSYVVDSGHGLHPWWLLDEPADPGDDFVDLLRGLRRIFAGDPAVCDLARIMRLPGTTNTKQGDSLPVRVIHSSERRYSFNDLQDWVAWQHELVGEVANPFQAAAEKLGVGKLVTIEDLAPGRIHDTQLRVSARMVTSGRPEDEIVAILLEATRLAAGQEGQHWDWRKEEHGLRQMIRTAQQKFVPVIDLGEERKKRTKPAEPEKHVIVRVGRLALESWGQPMITVKGELWTYRCGIWHQFDDVWKHELQAVIQGACDALAVNPGTSTLNGAYRWLLERPSLIRRDVAWNNQRLVVGANATLMIDTGEVVPHDPEHYATRNLGYAIDLVATCPLWERFLTDNLDAGCIATLQEWFGAALVRGKPRDLNKGLFVHGPGHTGKTCVTEVLKPFLGGNTGAPAASSLEDKFGLQELLGKDGWIADDSVGMTDPLHAERYKVVVTGEWVSVPRKNKGAAEHSFDIPVMMTMNSLPKIKDVSKAVYNRTLVLPMKREWPEGMDKDETIGRIVARTELSGVLNWSLPGWYRLRERCKFDPPPVMLVAAREFRDQNDYWDAFADLCLKVAPGGYVKSVDLHRIFNAWSKTEHGSRHDISTKLLTKMVESGAIKAKKHRMTAGFVWLWVHFTEPALAFQQHEFGKSDPVLSDLNKIMDPTMSSDSDHQIPPSKASKF